MSGISRETPTIFDGIFKRLLDLSDVAIVQLINGVFGENYSPHSKVDRLSTEYISEDLRKRLLDVLIAIDGENLCHIEAQINDDSDMVIRMFEYGYAVALRNRVKDGNITKMTFPKAKVIYWETTAKTPDKELLRLEFPDGTHHDYEVGSLKLLEHSIDELEQQKLAVLLPFYTLKLRKRVKNAKTSEERQALAEEMESLLGELIEAIRRGEQRGIITEPDMRVLIEHIAKLTDQLYKQEYDEFREVDSMYEGAILTYSEEAALKAEAKGREEGIEQGIERGIEQGREEVAKEMLAEGMDVRMVARITKLSEHVVLQLKNDQEQRIQGDG